MTKISTIIQKVGGKFSTLIILQDQSFQIGPAGTYEEAQWTGNQFNKALKRNDIDFETGIEPMKENKLSPGSKVMYHPGYGKKEKGIVKSLPEDSPSYAFVVYNCGGNWDNYEDYTAARTPISGLTLGWPDED